MQASSLGGQFLQSVEHEYKEIESCVHWKGSSVVFERVEHQWPRYAASAAEVDMLERR